MASIDRGLPASRIPIPGVPMHRLDGMLTRFAYALLTCALPWALAATAVVAAPSGHTMVAPKAFVQLARSGELEPESFDFDGAGFFNLTPAERMQWLGGVFSALGIADGSGPPACTTSAQRNGRALAWA